MLINVLNLNNNEEVLMTQPNQTKIADESFRYGLFTKKQPMARAEQTDFCYRINEHELWLQMGPGGHNALSRLDADEKGLMQKLGEQVGESMICYISVGYAFELTCRDVVYQCLPNQAIAVCLSAGEYQNVEIRSEKPCQIIRLDCVMLNPHDFAKDIGVEMLKTEDGYAKARLKLLEEHRGVNGHVDTGILFTMADEMCGRAAASVGGICTTMNCTIEYIRMPKIGEYIYGEALPIKSGRTIRNYTAYIRNEKNELICLMDAIFFNLQK